MDDDDPWTPFEAQALAREVFALADMADNEWSCTDPSPSPDSAERAAKAGMPSDSPPSWSSPAAPMTMSTAGATPAKPRTKDTQGVASSGAMEQPLLTANAANPWYMDSAPTAPAPAEGFVIDGMDDEGGTLV